MEDVHNLINFGPTNPIQILNQHEIFWRFCMCPSSDTFDNNKKSWSRYWCSTVKTTRDKANISNPKVNRGCAPLTANRTSADCVQISLGPSIPYIPLGVYRTGRFNAMLPLYSWFIHNPSFAYYFSSLIDLLSNSFLILSSLYWHFP